jgi:protease IV
MQSIVNELKTETPEGALKSKIITNLGYWDQFEAEMKTALKSKDKINYVGLMSYLNSDIASNEGSSSNRIAVIIADGEIVSGEGEEGQIGSDDYIKEIAKARKDKKVKAIVLRINSPGGSAMASDIMFREIELARKEKPVIASMGDYAASGGYYLAMGADSIVAQPTTITGSIGVFWVLFNTEGFFKNKLGITYDKVDTHTFADFPSATRTMSDAEKAKMQNSTNRIYDIFTTLAAKSRKMPVEKLRDIAGGRVWTGTDAKKVGLVDVIGSYQDAIKIAAKKAKLKEGDYQVKYTPNRKNQFETFFKKMSDDTEEKAMKAMLGNDLAPYAKAMKNLKSMEGVQMRMPTILEIQ